MAYINDEVEGQVDNMYAIPGYNPIYIIDDNDVSKMREYLRRGGNPNFKFLDVSLLGHARSVEMAQLLIDRGADLHFGGNGEGYTPLLYQALHQKLDIMKLLLDTDPTVIYAKTGPRGYITNALDLCIRKFYHKWDYNLQLECAKLLLAHEPKIDVNMKFAVEYEGDDSTVLNKAVRLGHTDIIKLLLENGAKPELDPGYEKYPSSKLVKQFISNRRNKTMYAQAYRGLADRIPENVIGNGIQGFLQGHTPGPHRFPSRNIPENTGAVNNIPNTGTTASRKTLKRRQQRARAKARERALMQSNTANARRKTRKGRKVINKTRFS